MSKKDHDWHLQVDLSEGEDDPRQLERVPCVTIIRGKKVFGIEIEDDCLVVKKPRKDATNDTILKLRLSKI